MENACPVEGLLISLLKLGPVHILRTVAIAELGQNMGILGNDFCSDQKCVINFVNETLQFSYQKVNMYKSPMCSSPLVQNKIDCDSVLPKHLSFLLSQLNELTEEQKEPRCSELSHFVSGCVCRRVRDTG